MFPRTIGFTASAIVFLLSMGGLFVLKVHRIAGVSPFSAGQSLGQHRIELIQIAMLAVAMLAGILFGFLYRRALQLTGGRFFLGQELRQALTSADFYVALFAAPLVFLGIYTVAKDAPGSAASVLFAFENGFFCKMIVERAERNAAQMAPGDHQARK
jgi:hypothetical protein